MKRENGDGGSPVNGYARQADVIVADAAQTGQNLRERRHDQVLAVSATNQSRPRYQSYPRRTR